MIGKRIVREGQKHTRGVYGRHEPTPSGIATADNLQAWSQYARSNSYHGRDPKGRGAGSDEHLLKPKGGFEFGADSGPSRIEKSKKY